MWPCLPARLDAIGVPVTAISQPERLAVGDYAYLVDASGAIAEAVAVLAFDAPTRPSISHAACSTPHPKHMPRGLG
jgi:hypothetical protein